MLGSNSSEHVLDGIELVETINLDRVGGKIASMGLVGQNKAPALFAETSTKTTKVLLSEVIKVNVPTALF